MPVKQSRNTRQFIFAITGAIALAGLTACGSTASSTPPSASPAETGTAAASLFPQPSASLIAAAKKEGTLVWDTGTTTPSSLQAIVSGFESAYPGISVKANPGTNALEAAFLAQEQAGSYQVDAVLFNNAFFTDPQVAKYMEPMDNLIPGFTSKYPKQYQFANGVGGTVYIIPNGFAYNTQSVTGANAPKSFADFEKPFWKGHLLTENPNQDVAAYDTFSMILQELGPQALQAIGKNLEVSNMASSFPSAAELLASEQGYAVIPMSGNNITPLAAKGAPLTTVVPSLATGGELGVAVPAHAPHAAAAQLFAEWAYSPVGQKVIAQANNAAAPLYTVGLPSKFTAPDLSQDNLSKIDQLLGIPQ